MYVCPLCLNRQLRNSSQTQLQEPLGVPRGLQGDDWTGDAGSLDAREKEQAFDKADRIRLATKQFPSLSDARCRQLASNVTGTTLRWQITTQKRAYHFGPKQQDEVRNKASHPAAGLHCRRT